MSRIAVLGASGGVGSELVRQALERGDDVIAISRHPEGLAAAGTGTLRRLPVDVLDLDAAAAPSTVVSVGALGTGGSAPAVGRLTRSLLGFLMRAELPDKLAADEGVRGLGGTVVHVGPMKNGPVDPRARNVAVEDVPRRFLPATISRATVAAAMLAAAADGPRGAIVVPVVS